MRSVEFQGRKTLNPKTATSESVEPVQEPPQLDEDLQAIISTYLLLSEEFDMFSIDDMFSVDELIPYALEALSKVATTYSNYRFVQQLNERESIRRTEEDLIGDYPDTIQAVATRLLMTREKNELDLKA